MYYLKIPRGWLLSLTILCSLIYACDSEIDPDIGGPGTPGGGNNQPGNQVDPDKASEYLLLDEATKVSGSLPTASDGNLKLSVGDTIFTVKGHPWGNRIRVLHDSTQSVHGFNIYVSGASHYFNVPEEIVDGQFMAEGENDTTSVVLLEIDPPVDEVNYPFTMEIIIQPLDEAGVALDEFSRWITVEDPEDSNVACNSITGKVWEWNFTLRLLNGAIENVWAPALGEPINTQGGGCCSGTGRSLTTVSPFCEVDINEPNMQWIEVYPSDYYVREYEYLQFGDDGSALADGLEIIKNWDLFNTDFCNNNLGYTWSVSENQLVPGTHDFVPGADRINFSFPDWEGGWRPRGGAIVYTCNTLVITYGVEIDTFVLVYKEWDGTQILDSEVIWHD